MDFFSPLGREYCSYFYWVTVLIFIYLLFIVYEALVSLVKGRFRFSTFLGKFLPNFILYFTNRLLYSICVN